MKIINEIKLYDKKETAELFGVHLGTVNNWVTSGKIRHTRIGPKVYISEEAIKDYLNGYTNTAEK